MDEKEQLYFNDTRTYTEDEFVLLSTLPARVAENYVLDIVVATTLPPFFSITATPAVGTPQEGDGVLSIDTSGEKLHGADPW